MNHAAKKGFTLIELMLAMSFIAVLLLAIAMTIIQISVTYSRGMALKEVNQTARDIGANFQRELSSVAAIAMESDYVTTTAGGRICLGSFSYIWNTGKALTDSTEPTITWYEDDSSHLRPIRFVKVPDSAKIYCAKNGTGGLTYPTIRAVDIPQAQELLLQGDHHLDIHAFALTSAPSAYDTATGQRLYTLDYTIGAGEVSAMNNDQSRCLDAGEPGSDLAYCNVQQFSLVIRAGDRV